MCWNSSNVDAIYIYIAVTYLIFDTIMTVKVKTSKIQYIISLKKLGIMYGMFYSFKTFLLLIIMIWSC